MDKPVVEDLRAVLKALADEYCDWSGPEEMQKRIYVPKEVIIEGYKVYERLFGEMEDDDG